MAITVKIINMNKLSEKIYLFRNETVEGPFTLFQLREFYKSGAVTLQTMFTQEGDTVWRKLEIIKGTLETSEKSPFQLSGILRALFVYVPVGTASLVLAAVVCVFLLIGAIWFFSSATSATHVASGEGSKSPLLSPESNSSSTVSQRDATRKTWRQYMEARSKATNLYADIVARGIEIGVTEAAQMNSIYENINTANCDPEIANFIQKEANGIKGFHAIVSGVHNGQINKAGATVTLLAMAKVMLDSEPEFIRIQSIYENKYAIENSLGMKFVPVPGTDVLISIWDTRVKDFRAYAEASEYRQHGGIAVSDGVNCEFDAKASWENPGFKQTDCDPVVGVSWDEAKAFCLWLTKKERAAGKIGKHQEYRLPTDAEWTMAGGSKKYAWGDGGPPPKESGNYGPPLNVDSFPNTSPVGSFAANQLGIYDMGGNVSQLCEDWYRASMNEALFEKWPGVKDDGGGKKYRVVRGASWNIFAHDGLLSSSRNFVTPDTRISDLGFRCVLIVKSSL